MSALPSPLKSPPDVSAVKPLPAGADLLGPPGHPAARSVAAVEQQLPVGRAGEHVGLAVAVPVPWREQRGEAAPAGADLDPAAREAAVAVTAVEQERAVGLAGEDVLLAVAAEVAGRQQRGEAAPAAADRLARAGREAAAGVAAVHEQPAVGLAGEQVGPAVAAPVGGEQGRERAPARADLRIGREEAPGAVAAVHDEPAVAVDREHVALAVAAPVGAGRRGAAEQGEHCRDDAPCRSPPHAAEVSAARAARAHIRPVPGRSPPRTPPSPCARSPRARRRRGRAPGRAA